MSLPHSILLLVVWAILLSGTVWGRHRVKKLKGDLSPEATKLVNGLLAIIQIAGIGMIIPLATHFNQICGFK